MTPAYRTTPAHTILLVDDSKLARALLRVFLAPSMCRVVESVTGKGALAIIKKVLLPDAIILDYHLPGKMTGAQFIREVRASTNPRVVPLPIILVSADSRVGEECAAASAGLGPLEILTKPISPAQLVGAISRHVPDFSLPVHPGGKSPNR